MIIDTHCHLNFRDYENILPQVLGNAKKAGVKKFIVPGVDYYSSLNAVKLAQENPGIIFASVGYHPYETDHGPDMNLIENLIKSSSRQQKTCLRSQADNRKPACAGRPRNKTPYLVPHTSYPIYAVGECGLDYHLFKGNAATGKKSRQMDLFNNHLILALKYNLPVIIHVRDAFDSFFEVLDRLPQIPAGVIHCFSGGLQDVRDAVKRNLYIGIDGNVTYSRQIQTVVPYIPPDKLLLETDSPNLTPVPYRGKKNEPKYLNFIAKKIAELKNTTSEKIKSETTENAVRLFNI